MFLYFGRYNSNSVEHKNLHKLGIAKDIKVMHLHWKDDDYESLNFMKISSEDLQAIEKLYAKYEANRIEKTEFFKFNSNQEIEIAYFFKKSLFCERDDQVERMWLENLSG